MPRIWLVPRFACWDVIVGLLEWNERFGIRFMRLSSEMFPFASHAELGYSVEFAKAELSAVGRIAMKYGHRLTMHPVFVPTTEVDVGSIHTDCVPEGECRYSIDKRSGVSCRVARSSGFGGSDRP